jgi:hypothetical protein
VRRRILAAVLPTTTLAVVAFFVPAALAIRNSQRRGDLLELQREASIVANRVATLQVDDGAELQAILDAHHPLGIYSVDGLLLVGSGPPIPDRIVAKLRIDSVTGLVHGSFRHPLDGEWRSIKGAILHKQSRALGFFRGIVGTGGLELAPTVPE